LIERSQEAISILDMTAVYERLLQRMTDIERGLNLHLNYNITKPSPRENFVRIHATQSEDEVKDDMREEDSYTVSELGGEFLPSVRRREKSHRSNDLEGNILSGDDIPEENHVKRTSKIIRRKRIKPEVTNLLSSNVKNTGGTKGPRPHKRSRKKQTTKQKQGFQDLSAFQKFSLGRNSNTMPPPPVSSQCNSDVRCDCCKKTGYPGHAPGHKLSQSEINTLQKKIDALIAKGCKVYHFQGSLFYSCDNK
jgi:hypothetical protein